MITIFVDNKPYQVRPDQNLLSACLSLGFDLPYFCWHPAMHSVGACRQCAVKVFKDEKDTRGRIMMSCMTPVSEGMRLSVDDPDAKAFRSSVIEWLMLNHPHDCPVCDEGGECHLQDMTVMTGHNYRRTRFKKRTHRNQDLGPFINHEMNRCIQCYRCVRFYRDYAGGRDFHVFAAHDNVYFGRAEEGVLESEFSGNLIEICPTGVFTDKSLKPHDTRKWDLQTAPSICVHCGLGCNTIPGERYGTLRRILNRYNREVNGYFLCDRGRFGYGFVNSNKRIRKPLVKTPLAPEGRAKSGEARQFQPGSRESALLLIKGMLSKSKGVVGIGSPRASLESNFVLRALVGPDRFCSGMATRDHRLISLIVDILRKGPARSPSLREVGSADAVLVLGEDLTNTAPLLALAVRQAARNASKDRIGTMRIPPWDDAACRNAVQGDVGPVYIAAGGPTKLDDHAKHAYRSDPHELARLGFAIAHEIDRTAPAVAGLTEDAASLAQEIAAALRNAGQPLVISGTSMGSEAIVQAAANIAQALCAGGKTAGLCFTVPECNSMGLGLMGGGTFDEAIKSVQDGAVDTVIILENDLFRRADENSMHDFFGKAKNVIVIDHLINPTSSLADIALPAATFAEGSGTLVNNEGRAQRFYRVFKPDHDVQESWRWIRDIITSLGRPDTVLWDDLDDITADLAALPAFHTVQDISQHAEFRISGQKIPRQPHRYSGRTAMLANIDVHEPKPADDPDSPLSFSMEGYAGQPPAPLIPRYWAPGWNSVQSLNKFQQEVGGPLIGGDPGIRLIEPKPDGRAEYFTAVPAPAAPGSGISAPHHDIFGSEELSIHAPAIAERMKDRGTKP